MLVEKKYMVEIAGASREENIWWKEPMLAEKKIYGRKRHVLRAFESWNGSIFYMSVGNRVQILREHT